MEALGRVLTLAAVGPAARGHREWSLPWSPVRGSQELEPGQVSQVVPGAPYMPSLKKRSLKMCSCMHVSHSSAGVWPSCPFIRCVSSRFPASVAHFPGLPGTC